MTKRRNKRPSDRIKGLLDENERVEWPKLFDPEFRASVVEEPRERLNALPLRGVFVREAISALDRFIDEVGDASGSAVRLREQLDKIDDEAVKLLQNIDQRWLEFVGDPANRELSLNTTDELFKKIGQASLGGSRSGESRRQTRDDDLTKAAEALNRLLDRDRMSEPDDYRLKEIETELAAFDNGSSRLPYSRLRHLTLRKIRAWALKLRRNRG